ncbi:MAG: lytic transglycosylase domain-containing protein [Treponema sp.]|nr:lytic transglycosylase domain-containing protein [Treponema sp.]
MFTSEFLHRRAFHKTNFKRLTTCFVAPLFLMCALSCKAATQPEGQKRFGDNADYFIGLRHLQDGNENAARTKFNRCIKKGNSLCAQKSAEALCTFGSIEEKTKAAQNLLLLYPGEDSILIAARQFSAAGEINKLIECTSGLDFTKTKNEIIRLRLEAMSKRGDSAYEDEVYRWFTECPLSNDHYQFYRDTYKHPDFDYDFDSLNAPELKNYTPKQFVLNYRIESYKRNYSYTMNCAEELSEYFYSDAIMPLPQLASDFGKNYLYGSMDFTKNANYFKQLAIDFKGTPAEFFFWFYAGRLFDKAGVYYTLTKQCFESAIYASKTPYQKDNALWYLLNSSLSFSMDSIISSIGEYSRLWYDPEYFEDFFESLASALLAAGKWNEFGKIYKAIDGYASDLTTAQFAYLYGRMIQEGLTEGSFEESEQAFKRALEGGSSVYYKLLAAYQLGLQNYPIQLQKIITAPTSTFSNTKTEDTIFDSELETLLSGYAYFGFPELIYPEWQKTQGQKLSTETNLYLAEFLSKCSGSDKISYYTQSLRIAARAQRNSTRRLTKNEIALVYPTHYKDFVSKYSAEYNINNSIMFALIRSESFFDANVTSQAGAIGLTQLMEFTAGDIARRFKMPSYTLTDPETNIRFGTYYLSNLISRCDNAPLLGFFSYNAGITRVRRWLQSSLIEFGKKSTMPLDLFLETVPYAETREYGRKLVSAAAIYQWMEDSASFEKLIEYLLY